MHLAPLARTDAARGLPRGAGRSRRALRGGGGPRVDRDALRYYEVLAVVKMAAIMLTGIRAFRDGRTTRSAHGDLRPPASLPARSASPRCAAGCRCRERDGPCASRRRRCSTAWSARCTSRCCRTSTRARRAASSGPRSTCCAIWRDASRPSTAASRKRRARPRERSARSRARRTRRARVRWQRRSTPRSPRRPPAPAPARVAALRADRCVDAFARLDALPAARADALRPLLGGHLAAQAVRDVLRLQGSLLEEISRG